MTPRVKPDREPAESLAVARVCTEVPAEDWNRGAGAAAVFGSVTGGLGTLYDCRGQGHALAEAAAPL